MSQGDRKIIDRVRVRCDMRGQQVRDDDRVLAEEFADLCSRVNDRLEECAGHLAKGLRSEAMYVIEEGESLLLLARLLGAGALKPWRDFCVQNGLPEPPQISESRVLQVATASDPTNRIGVALDEKLRLLRKATLLGQLPARIKILRKISALEPERGHWRVDLGAVEAARLVELKSELRLAVVAGDDQWLGRLCAEIESPHWLKEPPKTLLAHFEKQHAQVRALSLGRQAAHLAYEVSKAYGALDHEAIAAPLGAWTQLEQDPNFAPPSQLSTQVAEAMEWFAQEQRRVAEDIEFEGAVERIKMLLGRATDTATLQRALAKAESFGRDIPEATRDRAERTLHSLQLADARASRLKVLGVTLAGAAIVTLIVFGIREAVLHIQVSNWLEEIDQEIAEDNWEAAGELLQELEVDATSAAALPEIAARRVAIEAQLELIREAHGKFSALQEKLADMGALGFPDAAAAGNALESMAEIARGDAELLVVSRFRTLLEAAESERGTADIRRFNLQLTTIKDQLRVLASLDCEDDPSVCKEVLERIRRAMASAEALDLSPVRKARMGPLRRQVLAAEAKLSSTLLAGDRRVTALRDLYASLPDFDLFEQLLLNVPLQALADEERDRIERLTGALPVLEHVDQGSCWAIPDSQVALTVVETLQAKRPADEDPWGGDLASVREDVAPRACADTVRSGLQALAESQFLHDLKEVRCVDDAGQILTYYCYDDPEITRKTAPGVIEVVIDALNRQGRVISLREEHHGDSLEAKLTRHAQLLRELEAQFASGAGPQDIAVMLAGLVELGKLAEAEAIHSPAAAQIAVPLLSALCECDLPGLSGGEDLLRQLQACGQANARDLVDLGRNRALDPVASKRVQSAAVAVRALSEGNKFVSFRERWELQRLLRLAAVNRGVRCVGQVGAGGGFSSLHVPDADSQELWLAIPGQGNRPTSMRVCALLRGEAYEVVDDGERYLEPGTPIYEPTDGNTTQEVLRRVVDQVGVDAEALRNLRDWPAMWPTNERSLE